MVDESTGCWLYQGALNHGGYSENGHHRKMYVKKYGPVPKGKTLDHLCRIRHCVNPDHLEPVFPHENSRRSPLITKLTAEKVIEIRKKVSEKTPYRLLAEHFGVTVATICDIVKGRSWTKDCHFIQ